MLEARCSTLESGTFPAMSRARLASLFPSSLLNRSPFLPTPYGLLLLLVLLAILVGALNYENNLGLILAFLLGGILLAALLQARRCLAGLMAHPGEKPFLFAGRSGSLEVVLQGGQTPDFTVLVSAGGQPVTVTIPPRQPSRVRLPLKPARRGWLHIDDLKISTDFPFGLWRLRRTLDLPGRLLVYPRPLKGPWHGAPSASGAEGDRATGSGVDDFLGLRPYVAGDLMQRLAWKASSRGQGLFTKEFGRLTGGTLHFNWRAAGPGDTETRLSRLCHLVLTAKAGQLTYSLELPGQTIPAGSGEAHAHRCLRLLALYREAG